MTPLELLALVATFSLVRIGISMRPGITAPAAHTRLVVREYLDAFIVAGLVALVLVTFLIRHSHPQARRKPATFFFGISHGCSTTVIPLNDNRAARQSLEVAGSSFSMARYAGTVELDRAYTSQNNSMTFS